MQLLVQFGLMKMIQLLDIIQIDGTVSFPFKAPDGWSQNWLPSYIVFNQEKDFRPNEKIRTDLNLDDYMKFVLFFS